MTAVLRLSIPAIEQRMHSPDEAIVRQAAGALAEAGLPALPALATNLSAGGAQAEAAADSLGDVLDNVPDSLLRAERFRRVFAAAESPLAKALGGDRLVRRAAARALAASPVSLAAASVAALRVSVNTDDLATRHFAAQALARQSASKPEQP
jgi:hypothetical protein